MRSIHPVGGGHATNYADASEAFDFVLDRVLEAKVRAEQVILRGGRRHEIRMRGVATGEWRQRTFSKPAGEACLNGSERGLLNWPGLLPGWGARSGRSH